MKKIIIISLLITFSMYNKTLMGQGYEIKVKINNLKNDTVVLGHYFTKQSMLIPDDTVVVNKQGMGTFKGNKKLTEGMYFIFMPNKRLFDILVTDNQHFTVENDTADFIENMKISGDKQNQLFIDYQRFTAKQRKQSKELQDKYKQAKTKQEKDKIANEYVKINKSVVDKQNEIINNNPNSFFAKFLKSVQEINIPKSITSDLGKYRYYKSHYFNNFDYKDKRLLRTPVYSERLDFYLDKLINPEPDSLIADIDILVENTRYDKELFRNMLVHLFNKYAKSDLMSAENAYIHLAEKYYIPYAEWSDKEFIDELRKKVTRTKPALIGNIAPEIKEIMLPKDEASIEALKGALETMKEKGDEFLQNKSLINKKIDENKANFGNITDSALRSRVIISELAMILEQDLLPNFNGYISLHAQKSKYTILYFWEPDCSHCREETPKFAKAYDDEKLSELGVQVIAIYLQRNINEWDRYAKHIGLWFDFVLKNNMLKWTNVWEPLGYTNHRDKYNISSTPVLYLLDENKKIIAKRLGYKQAIEIIKKDIERKKKNK